MVTAFPFRIWAIKWYSPRLQRSGKKQGMRKLLRSQKSSITILPLRKILTPRSFREMDSNWCTTDHLDESIIITTSQNIAKQSVKLEITKSSIEFDHLFWWRPTVMFMDNQWTWLKEKSVNSNTNHMICLNVNTDVNISCH